MGGSCPSCAPEATHDSRHKAAAALGIEFWRVQKASNLQRERVYSSAVFIVYQSIPSLVGHKLLVCALHPGFPQWVEMSIGRTPYYCCCDISVSLCSKIHTQRRTQDKAAGARNLRLFQQNSECRCSQLNESSIWNPLLTSTHPYLSLITHTPTLTHVHPTPLRYVSSQLRWAVDGSHLIKLTAIIRWFMAGSEFISLMCVESLTIQLGH